MGDYYVNNNAQASGEHEVHKEDCKWMPINKQYLGNFNNCHEAIKKAKEYYPNVDGCFYCSNECHKR